MRDELILLGCFRTLLRFISTALCFVCLRLFCRRFEPSRTIRQLPYSTLTSKRGVLYFE